MTFTIRIAEHGISFPCEPHEFVLDAAERAGYSMPSSCRKGACNTCEAALVDGEVDQRGRGRRTAKDGSALMCRSRPRSDITVRPKRFERIDIFRRKTITARVFRLVRPAHDVTILSLRFPIGLRAPFKAGQYLQVVMEGGDRRNFSIANAARDVAETLDLKAIVAWTASGSTALRISRERPESPILALTPSHETACRLALAWGVHAIVTDDAQDIDDMALRACSNARDEGFASFGERVIIVAGVPFGTPGATNMVRIAYIDGKPK